MGTSSLLAGVLTTPGSPRRTDGPGALPFAGTGWTETRRLVASAPEIGDRLGTAGTATGIVIGSSVRPLDHDGPGGYPLHSLRQPNPPPLGGSRGLLDGAGRAPCSFQVPAGADPGLAGHPLHHAFVTFDLAPGPVAVLASNPIHLFIEP